MTKEERAAIEEEIARLRAPWPQEELARTPRWRLGRRNFALGAMCAREVAADNLQAILDLSTRAA